jgi:hypothetical protein
MSWRVPEELLVKETVPSAPTGTMAKLGVVSPATKFTFEVPGCWVGGASRIEGKYTGTPCRNEG